jgi:hypothetical protein
LTPFVSPQEKGITLREDFAVTAVEKGKIVADAGGDVKFDECLWCTQAGPPQWLKDTGLPLGSLLPSHTYMRAFLRVKVPGAMVHTRRTNSMDEHRDPSPLPTPPCYHLPHCSLEPVVYPSSPAKPPSARDVCSHPLLRQISTSSPLTL